MSPLRVFTRPTGPHSRAMVRVANALERYMPPTTTLAGSPASNYCDVQILHTIDPDAVEYAENLRHRNQRYAVIQYCLETAGFDRNSIDPNHYERWFDFWRGADIVWSYYDMRYWAEVAGLKFMHAPMHAPLGLDDAFLAPVDPTAHRKNLIITTGYVHGPGAEAISEVWQAAVRLGIGAIHVGPQRIEGMADSDYPPMWNTLENISDEDLAALYRRAKWVASLRHCEGFELPAAEALSCGARPIVFNQPTMRHWYGNLVTYIPECSGSELVNALTMAMLHASNTASNGEVSASEISRARMKFNWQSICEGFWSLLLGGAQ